MLWLWESLLGCPTFSLQSWDTEFWLFWQQLVREDKWLWQAEFPGGKGRIFLGISWRQSHQGCAGAPVWGSGFGTRGLWEALGWKDLVQVGSGRVGWLQEFGNWMLSWNHWGWKSSVRSWSPTIPSALPRVPKCHIPVAWDTSKDESSPSLLGMLSEVEMEL